MHPYLAGIEPVAAAAGGKLVAADKAQPGDIPVSFDGQIVGGFRPCGLHDALDRLIDHVEREIGTKVTDLDRAGKRDVVHRLDKLGAFMLRKAVEDIADRLEVSRFTVYNYLNAQHA